MLYARIYQVFMIFDILSVVYTKLRMLLFFFYEHVDKIKSTTRFRENSLICLFSKKESKQTIKRKFAFQKCLFIVETDNVESIFSVYTKYSRTL